MQKIISLFQRNYDGDHLVRDEVVPGAEWVLAGEGVATRKWDGTCCLWKGGRLWKRYDLKPGKKAPAGFVAVQEPAAKTGKQPGWLPVGDGPEDKWHRKALTYGDGGIPVDDTSVPLQDDQTYELCGPKVQGNPEHVGWHMLHRHGAEVVRGVPRDFVRLKAYFTLYDIEGIVWHHQDGRMVKVKGKDFGIKRAARKQGGSI